MEEIWRAIPDYRSYEASNFGRIRRLPHVDHRGSRYPGKIVKLQSKGSEVNVQKDARWILVRVGHLVLRAFKGRPRSGHRCRHLDGDLSNNVPDNLAWRKFERGKWGKRKLSLETRLKISAALKGRPPSFGMKGKKHSPATRGRISATKKGRPSPLKGRKLAPRTEETKTKISATLKLRRASGNA